MDGLRFVSVRPNFPGDSNRFPRPRPVTSCLQCRRRKVRCDHVVPQCSACRRGNYPCSYANTVASTSPATTRVNPPRVTREQQEPPASDVLARLQRLETLIERAADVPQPSNVGAAAGHRPENPEISTGHAPVQQEHQTAASGSLTPALSSDGLDGTLLLEDGQSHYVSSVHWALLADEIHDIRTLLKDHAEEEHDTSGGLSGPNGNDGFSILESQTSMLFGNTGRAVNLSSLLPKSPEDCHYLLNIFFSNVDPMTRIVHKPSLSRRFQRYVELSFRVSSHQQDGSSSRPRSRAESLNTFEPLAYAIMYSAVNSMRPDTVQERFEVERNTLLRRFQRGAELSLDREDVLTTSSLEVLQGFVLLLSSQFREDDLGKAWPLTGLAIRIAIDQGLHREPSLFPSRNMDFVQAELRRRVWHQLCHLDFRSAEGKGHEPAISDDEFTTLLPRHINDEDLVEGAPPSTLLQSSHGFTDMTTHLIRLNGIHCFRKVVQSTYRLERRIKTSTLGEHEQINPVAEIQNLYEEVRSMVDVMLEKQRTTYLCYCDPSVPLQGMALGLAALLEWKCWVIFWLRIPRAYREVVMPAEVRTMIFEKSVMLVENLMAANLAKEAEPFHWHISGHSAFQAIMHVLSELKTPEFSIGHHDDIRARAFDALQMMRTLKEKESSKTWKVVRRVIDRTIPPNYHSGASQAATSAPAQESGTFNHGTSTQSSYSTIRYGDGTSSVRGQSSMASPYDASFDNNISSWSNGNEITLSDTPDLSDLSGEFDWGWWNLDSLPWSPPG